ncbi:MAG TPA: glycosyltransferase family 39 protein [Thermoanaerobaculia bacterium]|nr:glycosyltransferase family 39 protein [Thermoanaerobaculia bacterium]
MSTAKPASLPALAGLVLVGVVRALTLPRSLWELDEVLFARAVERFDPLSHRPHPPGYPLLAGLGKLFNLVFGEPFSSLVTLSFVSSIVGYLALVAAFRRIDARPGAERTAVAGALLFQLSPVMLVQGPLPMSDPPALMFIALSLAAGALLASGGPAWSAMALGACASAAIGCRPQLALAVLPMLVAALWQAPDWRRRRQTLAAFTIVSLAWFVPLVVETGGFRGLLDYQLKQASYVAGHDASASRGGREFFHIASIFIAHPWGPKWLALPVFLLALAGAAGLIRHRRTSAALPLAVLAGAQLVACLLVMDPADGARYALPVVLGVAFLAGAGCEAAARRARRPVVAWLLTGLLLAASALYTWPMLRVRSTTFSPPAKAVQWAKRNLPPKTMLLVEHEMEAHASYMLAGYDLAPVDEGLRRATRRPRAPLYLFSEGESTWPGAVIFRWPDTDAYRRLTRNHYRVVSLSPIPTGQRFQILRGIHGWEPTAREARWRWMDAGAALQIFPRGDRAVAVKLALDPAAPLPSNSVAVSVNGAPAATVAISRGMARSVELPIPSQGPVEIAFQSARSFQAPDGRRLAVQLLAVERIPG